LVCKDKGDNKFIKGALSDNVTYSITGDEK